MIKGGQSKSKLEILVFVPRRFVNLFYSDPL
jgi:hypothetical protein